MRIQKRRRVPGGGRADTNDAIAAPFNVFFFFFFDGLVAPQESLNQSLKKLIAGYHGYAQQVALVNNWLQLVSRRRLPCRKPLCFRTGVRSFFAQALDFFRNGKVAKMLDRAFGGAGRNFGRELSENMLLGFDTLDIVENTSAEKLSHLRTKLSSCTVHYFGSA